MLGRRLFNKFLLSSKLTFQWIHFKTFSKFLKLMDELSSYLHCSLEHIQEMHAICIIVWKLCWQIVRAQTQHSESMERQVLHLYLLSLDRAKEKSLMTLTVKHLSYYFRGDFGGGGFLDSRNPPCHFHIIVDCRLRLVQTTYCFFGVSLQYRKKIIGS